MGVPNYSMQEAYDIGKMHQNNVSFHSIGKQYHISDSLAKKYYYFFLGIEKIKKIDIKTAMQILSNEFPITKQTVIDYGKTKDDYITQKTIIGLKNNIDELYDTENQNEYTLDMLREVIIISANKYISSLSNDIELHKDLLTSPDNYMAIISIIDNRIIKRIKALRRRINNEFRRISQ